MPFELLQKESRSAKEIRDMVSAILFMLPTVINGLIGTYIAEEKGFNPAKDLTDQTESQVIINHFFLNV